VTGGAAGAPPVLAPEAVGPTQMVPAPR
jgi:hypothetical protein